jgi:hypothetical protein
LARGDDSWQKLRRDGAEVYYADLDLRAAFAKTGTVTLPEARRKRPAATDRTFDWTRVLLRDFVLRQADSATCWAFAPLTAFEYNWVLRNGGRMPLLAVQPILDRTGKYGSGSPAWALTDLLDHGTCLASNYPHVGKPGKLLTRVPMRYRAIAWGLVAGTGGTATVEQLKRALLDHGPLIAHVHVTPAFKAYKGGVFRDETPPGVEPSGHFVVLVGWDDSKGKGGCWRIENSWGEGWGEQGFMWLDYSSNNIADGGAWWVRAQANQYQLPDDIHKRVSAETDPSPRWPNARKLTVKPSESPVLTPAEARGRQGERVAVQFRVRGGDVHPREGHVQLFSEKNWWNEDNLNVRILKSELGKFPARSDRELLESYLGKEIRVRGSVQANLFYLIDKQGKRKVNRPIIEVGDPEQIEVVK